MSLTYIPSPAAEPLSNALWGLARLPALRSEKDTQYLFPWKQALDQTLWLEVDTEYQITVHKDAVLGGIAGILQPFIDAGELPADTNTKLEAYIFASRGQVITVYSAFPDFFKSQAKDKDQMILEGLLANPGVTI